MMTGVSHPTTTRIMVQTIAKYPLYVASRVLVSHRPAAAKLVTVRRYNRGRHTSFSSTVHTPLPAYHPEQFAMLPKDNPKNIFIEMEALEHDFLTHSPVFKDKKDPFEILEDKNLRISVPANHHRFVECLPPGVQMAQDGSVWTITVNLPWDLKASDLQVELEKDCTVAHVFDKRRQAVPGQNRHFSKRFNIGPNMMNVNLILAKYSRGSLRMVAPKRETECTQNRQTNRQVPIWEDDSHDFQSSEEPQPPN